MPGTGNDGARERPEVIDYRTLATHRRVEQLSAFERRSTWDVQGHSGTEHLITLRSGMSLTASSCRWRQPLSVYAEMPPSPLSFMVSRGPGMHATVGQGDTKRIGGGVLEAFQVTAPVYSRFDAQRDAHDEIINLDIAETRLTELAGGDALTAPLRRRLADKGPYAHHAAPMTPELFHLLDEILYCDVTGPTRQLYLEAKGLELLSRILDQFAAAEHAAAPQLSQADTDRLQRARELLVARLDAPPPCLAELARQVGLNEAKLKAGFRILFGSSVFAYLRAQRMEAARRLLRARQHNVTEVALRVGYANPSKFAAAFRKQFGISPSAVA